MAVRKTIFVTGAGSGIGRAIAQRFAQGGWFVGLGDSDIDALAETEALLPGGFTYCQWLDVARRDDWAEALRIVARASGGRIDVVANCAGSALSGPLSAHQQDEIDQAIDAGLRGAIYGAQAAYPWLKETAPGSCLLNTAGTAALYGMPGQSLNGVAMAGLRSLTESLDAEWARDGINVRSLMPDPSGTPAEDVAEAAWQAVHGDRLHHPVGKAAKRLHFMSKWAPSALRRHARQKAEERERTASE